VIGALTKVTHPDGTFRSLTYTNATLPYYVASVTDERQFVTHYTRDSDNRITRITYPDGGTESFTYNSFGEVTAHTAPNGGIWTYVYDEKGNKTSQVDPLGNTFDFAYDSMGRLAKAYEVARGLSTLFTYNALDEITKVTNPDGSTSSYTYDEYGNRLTATNELGNTSSWTYDSYGRVLTSTDPLKRKTTYSYTSGTLSPLAFTNDYPTSVTSASGARTAYSYDAEWDVLSTTFGAGTVDASTSSPNTLAARLMASSLSLTLPTINKSRTHSEPFGNITTHSAGRTLKHSTG
jgi:YD repeat-containing protein